MALTPLKRPVVYNSEDEEQGSSEDHTAEIKRIKRDRNAQRDMENRRASGVQDTLEEREADDAEDGEAADLGYPDDAANIKAFEAARERQGISKGSASDAGLIKSVTLIDFMCHRHLKVDFGARMNFLVGHNGSGKSAILTGIAVALGGRAAVTGRGQGLKDLIRKGCDKAIITLTMANRGPEAYKTEMYHQNVIIERTLMKSGASSYKFRAERGGRILASKRDELTQICQWFNITIDSPLTVLTQDQARSFLQNADDSTLYKFFLEGTQLHALANSYTQIEQTLYQIRLVIEQQRSQVPDLENQVATLGRQRDASMKIVELKNKSRLISGELAWAYVVRKEQERNAEKARTKKLEKKLADIISETEECQRKWQPATDEIQRTESELREYDASRMPLEQARARSKKKHEDARKELKDMEESGKEAVKAINASENEVGNLDRRIADRRRAMDANADPEQATLRTRHGEMDNTLRKLTRDVPYKEDLIQNISLEREQASDRLGGIDRQIDEVGGHIGATSGNLRNLEGQSTDRLSAFGTNLTLILDEIRKTRWVHSPPIGPLGLYVKLEDMDYKDAFHSLLGQILCTFAVRDHRDRSTMLNILQRCAKSGYRAGTGKRDLPPIIQHSGDMFDYTAGDLRRYGETVLSKLRIENEHVLRILINASSIESTFVSPTLVLADKALQRLTEGGHLPRCVFISADGFHTQGRSGNKTSGPSQNWNGNMLFTKDLAADIESTKRELGDMQSLRARLLEDRKMATNSMNQIEFRLADARRKLDQVKRGIPSMQIEMDKIQEKLKEQPSNEIDGLEAAKRELQDEQDQLHDKVRAIEEDKKRVQIIIEQLVKDVTRHDAELEEFMPEKTKKQAALQTLIEERTQLQMNLKHWNSSKDTTEAQHNEAAEGLERSEAELTDWTKKAEEYWRERIDTRRTPPEIEREREAVTRAVADAEKRHGVRTDEILPAYEIAKGKLNELQQSITNLNRLHMTLMTALRARRRWWTESREHIAVRARCLFILNLQKRNYEGRLDFDHAQERLSVRIKTTGIHSEESQDRPTQARFKAPKNLSGGERSFSTVSLLVALWDTTSSPIRCLDEWDVFLDHMNRNLAAKMLVEGARESDGKQFILITPQDMGGVQTGGPDNRVIRLSDPTRNQATLDFQAA